MEDKVMNHRGYQGSIAISLEDNVIFGSILNINDLVTYEAETPEGLKAAFIEAVEDYLEFCKKKGVSPDKPVSGSFNVRIGQELHKKAVQFATKKDIALNELVKSAVASYLECDGKEIHHHYHVGEFEEAKSWVTRVSIEAQGHGHTTKFSSSMKVVH